MASFDYRLNPRYAIKECSSCGTLYTRDCSCSKGNVEDKILVPKPPKNCARCGHPVDGPYCQGCTFSRKKLEEDLNSLNDSPSISANSSHNPPHIDERCFECGDALDGIFCQRCACTSCGKGAHIGYNCPPKVPIISNPEPCNQTMNNEPPQTLPSFDPMCYSVKENSSPCVSKPNSELAEYINTPGWNRPTFYNNGDDDDVDYTIAITPVLSTEEPDNSLSTRDEHLDTILATESDDVIKSSVEDLVPIPSESEGILDTMCDVHLVNNPTPFEAKDHFEIVINSNDDYSSSDDDSLYYENIEYIEASPHDYELVSLEVEKIVIPEDEEIEDDNLHEKLLKINLLIAEIEALKDNPTPSSKFLTKSSSTSPKPFLEGTDTFDNFLPEFENFCFDLEEISSGSTTTHSDISLMKYEAFSFYDDHIEEISSGSTTTQSDFTHEEFGDKPAHIISPPEYDCFYFGNLPDLVEDDHSPLLAYVVWIFLAYLTYPVIPPHLHSFGNEDTIFDPGITINRSYSSKPGLSHQCGTFKKFNTHRSHLKYCPMEMLFSILFPMDQ
nr:hypothetical protein [Tanacetum cinerariifolium]